MPVKIRLQRKGRKKAPYYHIVIADARAPRDGKFIEKIGFYNPMTLPASIDVDRDKALDWMEKGAQPTDTVRAILRFKGVLYKKHLLRGVKKGAMTQEQADAKFKEWVDIKDAKVAARVDKTKAEKLDRLAALSGKPKAVEVVEEVVEAAPVVEEAAAPEAEAAVEKVADAAVEKVEEAAPKVEAAVEEVKKETSDDKPEA